MSLRHRHKYAVVLPRGLLASFEIPARELPARNARCAPHPAQIRQIRAGVIFKGRKTPVPRVLLAVPLAGPAPSGSTDTPRLCQGRSRPPRHHPDQAALSSTPLLRQAGGEGLSPPLESQRLTAQLETDPGAQVRRGPFTTGQVSSRHAAIFASSRSAARRAGTCTLHPIRCSSRSAPARV